MLANTHSFISPWIIVHANDKPLTRLNVIKDMLSRLDYADKDERLILSDPQIVTPFAISSIEKGLLAS
jgi:hypothetical protein